MAGGSTLLDGGEHHGYAQSVGRGIAPHAWGDVQVDPGWFVSPLMQLRGGYEGLESVVYAPRVGGQVPYVIPLAGAAWAEFVVQSYVATRVAVALGKAGAGPGSGAGAPGRAPTERLVARGLLGADLAYFRGLYPRYPAAGSPYALEALYTPVQFDDQGPHVGLLARVELRRGRAWLQAEGGYSPTLEHETRPASAMLRLGVDWGTGAPW